MGKITTYEKGDLFKQYIDNANNTLRILVTKKCNSSCKYCFEEGSIGSTNYMPELLDNADFRNIILAGKHLGVNRVTLSGGEPTLNFSCVESLVDLCVNENIPVYLTTNATDNRIINLARKYPSLEFRISLESSKENYKNYRGIDKFDEVIKNLKDLSSCTNEIVINRVVTSLKTEWEDFNNFVNLIKNEKINSTNVYLKMIPCLANNIAEDLPIISYVDYLSKMNPGLKINICQKKFQFFYDFKYNDVNILIRTKGVHSPKCCLSKDTFCDEGIAWTRINPNGVIQPCYNIFMDTINHGDAIPTIEKKLSKSREFMKGLYIENYDIKSNLGL
ncbi:MAG: radical SAM protein [Candidatus Nanoarchaeia archaeon]|jgi:MoaA/NifB/PqqE/SkfB family radical SAM enzyme